MTATQTSTHEITELLKTRWQQVSAKIQQLADALPETSFETVPSAGLRTSGAVLRHVAFWNHYVADSLLGNKTDDSTNELPVSVYGSKVSVLEALKKSSDEAAAALATADFSAKTVGLIVTFLEHTSEHYGQLAVYARLLGITPPASAA